MRRIMILEEKDLKGADPFLQSAAGDWEKQADDIFVIRPYNTIQCLRSSGGFGEGCTVADLVKYILPD